MTYPVRAELVQDRIHVTWDRNDRRWGEKLQAAKRVPGANFASSLRVWTYPITMQTCKDLRAVFGAELGIGQHLAAWYREQAAALDSKRSLARVSEEAFAGVALQHLPTLAPTLHAAMATRAYQLPAAKAVADHRVFGNWDEPGLGKTLDALAAIIEGNPDGGTFLVGCPVTSVHVVWGREIERWTSDVSGGFEAYEARGDRAKRETTLAEFAEDAASPDRARWMVLVVNHEMLNTHEVLKGKPAGSDKYERIVAPTKAEAKAFRETHSEVQLAGLAHEYPELFKRVWDGVIVDESHQVLISNSKADTLVRRGYKKIKVAPNGLKAPLTGSLLRGKKHRVWGTLNWMHPERYSSFFAFLKSYFETGDNGFGIEIGDLRPDREEAFYSMLDEVGLRRTKDELHKLNPAWAPPPRSYFRVYCDMGPKQEKIYRKMEADASVLLQGGQLDANGVLAEMTRLRQFAHAAGRKVGEDLVPEFPSCKYDAVVAKLAELGIDKSNEGTNKVVIASQFTKFIRLYADRLRKDGIDCLQITGSESERKRSDAVERFMDPNGPRVILLQTKTGGVSITLDIADDVFILDETWIPDDQDQVEGRVHRTSNVTHKVRCWYFVTEGTIEEHIGSVVDERDNGQRHAMDGRRGVEFARKNFEAKVKTA